MSYSVYVIKSDLHGTLYIGSTQDINNRIREHNQGRCRYTKGRMPWTLLYEEEYNSRSEAMRREKFLKSGKGRQLLKDQLLKS